jgi:hypothetical protein
VCVQNSGVVLAATVHDSAGRLVPALARSAGLLTSVFSGIALNISDASCTDVVTAAKAEIGATTMVHAQGEAAIGRARRDAVALALELQGASILYCDFDHAIRWIEQDADEVRRVLASVPDADMLVIGRSSPALARSPARLRETERLVNHVYSLITGRNWDLLFAIRRLSPAAAREIVRSARVDTIANDVEWPLLAERAGYLLAYAEADGLVYRTMDEFDAPADTQDSSAFEWIRRLEFAALQASAMRPFLAAAESVSAACDPPVTASRKS